MAQFEFSMSTTSGYDTRNGKDAICWVGKTQHAPRAEDEPESLIPFTDFLYEDFQVQGEIKMENQCPTGTALDGFAPAEFHDPNFVPRIGIHYNFSLKATIDLRHTQGDVIVSDHGSAIALNILFCDVRTTTFCTPFVHLLEIHAGNNGDGNSNHGSDHKNNVNDHENHVSEHGTDHQGMNHSGTDHQGLDHHDKHQGMNHSVTDQQGMNHETSHHGTDHQDMGNQGTTHQGMNHSTPNQHGMNHESSHHGMNYSGTESGHGMSNQGMSHQRMNYSGTDQQGMSHETNDHGHHEMDHEVQSDNGNGHRENAEELSGHHVSEIDNVFNHTEGQKHGNTHVHSTEFLVPVDPNEKVHHIEINLPIVVHIPGEFVTLARIGFFTSDSRTEPPKYKYEVGNILDVRVIEYDEPPLVLRLSPGIQVAFTCLIGLCCLSILYLLLLTVKYRTEKVMKLCQGDFLVAFLGMALISAGSSALLARKTDLQCTIAPTMVLLPLHIMYAIVGGRLWRIHSTISPALLHTLQQDTSWTRQIFEFITCRRHGTKNRMRSSVNSSHLLFVIVLLILPQVIIQVANIALYTSHVDINYNEDQSIGSTICSNTPLVRVGYFFEFGFLVGLVFVANQTRILPSLLNETEAIYEFSLATILVSLIYRMIMLISDSPTTSPNLRYVIEVSCILITTLNTCFRIMLPKFRLIWEGQTVTMSGLMESMKDQANLRYSISSHTMLMHSASTHGGGRSMLSQYCYSDPLVGGGGTESTVSRKSSEYFGADTIVDDHDHDDDANVSRSPLQSRDAPMLESVAVDSSLSAEGGGGRLTRSSSFSALDTLRRRPNPIVSSDPIIPPSKKVVINHPTRGTKKKDNKQTFLAKKAMEVKQGEAPPQKLVLKMVALKESLTKITGRVMMGFSATPNEWEEIRGATVEMGSLFQDRVIFDWEPRRKQIRGQDPKRVGNL